MIAKGGPFSFDAFAFPVAARPISSAWSIASPSAVPPSGRALSIASSTASLSETTGEIVAAYWAKPTTPTRDWSGSDSSSVGRRARHRQPRRLDVVGGHRRRGVHGQDQGRLALRHLDCGLRARDSEHERRQREQGEQRRQVPAPARPLRGDVREQVEVREADGVRVASALQQQVPEERERDEDEPDEAAGQRNVTSLIAVPARAEAPTSERSQSPSVERTMWSTPAARSWRSSSARSSAAAAVKRSRRRRLRVSTRSRRPVSGSRGRGGRRSEAQARAGRESPRRPPRGAPRGREAARPSREGRGSRRRSRRSRGAEPLRRPERGRDRAG